MLVGGFAMYRILVCDDEKDIVSALKIYLMAEGYEVFEANNGKQALQIIGHTGIAGLVHTLAIVDIVCHVTSS